LQFRINCCSCRIGSYHLLSKNCSCSSVSSTSIAAAAAGASGAESAAGTPVPRRRRKKLFYTGKSRFSQVLVENARLPHTVHPAMSVHLAADAPACAHVAAQACKIGQLLSPGATACLYGHVLAK
jgi:hypothetical protein